MSAINHSHRHPWTGQQRMTVVVAGALVVAFSVAMFLASGAIGWLALLLIAPAASWWAYHTNASRKNRSEVLASVSEGNVLTCSSGEEGSGNRPVALDTLDRVSLVEERNRRFVVVVGDTGDGDEHRAKIPTRVFTPGNPIGPAIIEAAENKGVHISHRVRDILIG